MDFNADMLKMMRSEMIKMREQLTAEGKIAGKEISVPTGTESGDMRCLIYKPEGVQGPTPLFLNLHGGGFVMGDPEGDDYFCNLVCKELGITVISLDYPLAPETKFPKDKQAAYGMVKYVAEHADEFGIDPQNMAIGGHSAGANLSTVICMMAKKSGDFGFKCQVLDFPPLDIAKNPYEKWFAEGAIPPEVAEMFNACYCDSPEAAADVYCSPVLETIENLQGMPPAIMLTCEIDSLRDEAEEYGWKLAKAGVEVTMKRFLGVPHGFTSDLTLPQAAEGHKMMIDGLRKFLL